MCMACSVDPNFFNCLSIFIFGRSSVRLKTFEDLGLVISIVTADYITLVWLQFVDMMPENKQKTRQSFSKVFAIWYSAQQLSIEG